MKPIDYRNAQWEDIQEALTALRLHVLNAWRMHGPGTTREVARCCGIDLLTFRPRTTELYQLGLVVLADEPGQEGTPAGHEGRYRALSDDEARRAFEVRCHIARSQDTEFCQPELKLQTTTAQ